MDQSLVPGRRQEEDALLPGPWSASGGAPAAFTSSEELLCPGFSLLAPASFRLVCTVFLSQTSEFLHKYRVSEKTLLCCGLFGTSMWEPWTKANSSHGKLVQSLQTWGQVSCPYPEPGAGVLVWSYICQSQSGWSEKKVYGLLLLVSCL